MLTSSFAVWSHMFWWDITKLPYRIIVISPWNNWSAANCLAIRDPSGGTSVAQSKPSTPWCHCKFKYINNILQQVHNLSTLATQILPSPGPSGPWPPILYWLIAWQAATEILNIPCWKPNAWTSNLKPKSWTQVLKLLNPIVYVFNT